MTTSDPTNREALKSGVLPNEYDLRDHSQEQTFGAVAPLEIPLEYNADLALDFPDQNADGYPNGCSGYTQTETGQDEYGIPFHHPHLYEKTIEYFGYPPGSPVKIRDSLKASSIFGLKPRKGDVDPTNFRRGKYFDVDKVGDYFDGARSALWTHRLFNRTISAGGPWQWTKTLGDGMMRFFDKTATGGVWHNFKICGWKTIKGKPYLIIKAWLGPEWGDKGYGYMSREIFNKLMSVSGTFMYIQANAKPEDIKNIKLDIYELILTLMQRLFKSL